MTADVIDVARSLVAAILPPRYERPADWASRNIIFNSPRDPIHGPLDFTLSPFLVDPINAWETVPGQGLKEVTLCAPEQMGKTMVELSGLCWRMTFFPGLSLVTYTSDDKAARVNEEKFEPILGNIPRFSKQLEEPLSRTKDCYRLGENLVYFGGVGSRVSSHSAGTCIIDECDDYQNPPGVDAINDTRKRSRAFRNAVLYKACTVKGSKGESRIWREFLSSSQGYWYLRCLGCGELTIRSCDLRHLQFDRTEDGDVIPASLRVVCPACGHRHIEDDKLAMNLQGEYIHKKPERLAYHAGFQFGALAAQVVNLGWIQLARWQAAAGSSGKLEDQIFFDNSVRGLPFEVRRIQEDGSKALRRHSAPLPDPEKIRFRFLSADTQDSGWFWVVRGLDAAENTYLLGCGKAENLGELGRVWESDWHGGKISCGIIDEGGHRAQEVRYFIKPRPGLFAYKGNPRIGKKWSESKEISRLLLGNPRHYHMMTLYAIYGTGKPGSHYWYLPEQIAPDYAEQICSWRANKSVRNGDRLENYHCPTGNDHFFDCEKMMILLKDYFCEKILPELVARKSAGRKIVRV